MVLRKIVHCTTELAVNKVVDKLNEASEKTLVNYLYF